MAKSPVPKLDLCACDDKRESVELWNEQFGDWCLLQGWRDASKKAEAQWIEAHYAQEISAFRLAMPLNVLKMIKSTIVPMLEKEKKADHMKKYIVYPWVWENHLLAHYGSQDTVLADRMTFMETCKQRKEESITDFEARCKYHGSKCEYSSMKDVEQELIRDRFATGVLDDKLRADLLRHKNEDGSIVTLAAVVTKARAWEAANMTNQKVIEALRTEEQVNYTSHYSHARQDGRRQRGKPQGSRHTGRYPSKPSDRKKYCGYCGEDGQHTAKTCPAAKPGLHCYKCYGDNHFANVCRNEKDKFKRQWLQSRNKNDEAHALEEEEREDTDSDDGCYYQYALCVDTCSVNAVDSTPRKLFTELALSLSGDNFIKLPFQIDTAASCNTMPLNMFLLIGKHSDLRPSKSTLMSYSGDVIKTVGKVTLMSESSEKYDTLDFEVIDTTAMQNKPALLGMVDSLRLKLVKIDEKRTYTSSSKVAHATPKSISSISESGKDASATLGSMSKEHILSKYSEVFKGLGNFGNPVSFTLDNEVSPVHAPIHRIPVAKREKVKKKIDEMVEAGKLQKVDEPTDWCSNMTVVEKKKPNGDTKIRICLDPSQTINRAIIVPKYTIPILHETLPRLSAKKYKYFTIMDALDGFTQVTLDTPSSKITTMHTPWGRYRWLRLPYGTSASPEEFQKRMHEALDGLVGVANIADDIMVFGLGDTPAEAEIDHDRNLLALMQRVQVKNVKLNPSKVQFKLKAISFMGHVITEEGIRPDPAKVKAIMEMPEPVDRLGVQRFIGMITYLSDFCPKLAMAIHPLHELTKPDLAFIWAQTHASAFKEAKQLMASTPCLAYFDVSKAVTLQVDASETGLGGALLQPDDSGKLQPVAFSSGTMRPNEVNWAQIEKETLAICAACEKWDLWLYGKAITIHTDHQPLETIFKKTLAKAPRRLQKLMMRLQRYNITVVYKKGSSLVLADTLSRAYLPNTQDHKSSNFELFRVEVQSSEVQNSQITPRTISALREATMQDTTMQLLANIICGGWPKEKSQLPPGLSPYWVYRDEMSVTDGIVYRGLQAVVPVGMQKDMLKKVHCSHLGAESNIRMCKDIIYWPGMQSAIKDVCSNCGTCAQYAPENPKEPMKSQPVPQYPWQIVSQDLCQLESSHYLITVDHYSDFIEIDELDDTLSSTVIRNTKAHFARHGIPEILLTDNGPQFVSVDFASFCDLYGITHVTSSPYWPKGNGKAESAVKVMKALMNKSTDIYMALLHYRNTPQQGHTMSPSQRSMGRRTRNTLPVARHLLMTSTSDLVQDEIAFKRSCAKIQYDKTASGSSPDVSLGDYVYVKPSPHHKGKPWQYGQIVSNPSTRSYVVDTPNGHSRRNRAQVRLAAAPPHGALVPRSWKQVPPTRMSDTLRRNKSLSPIHVKSHSMNGPSQLELPGPDMLPASTSMPPASTSVPPASTSVPPASTSMQFEPSQADGQTDPSLEVPGSPCPQMSSPYKTRAGRTVKPRKVYDPSN
jgi:transposase InsO family protein